MTLKREIYNRCLEIVNERIVLLQSTLNDLFESAANESKSSAGDKHETALAMLQIEQENTGRQLKETLAQKLLLIKIDIDNKSKRITNGSLVKTNKGYLFLCIALGKVNMNHTTYIVLSLQSPLGSKLVGLKVNDTADMNGVTYIVEDFF